MGRLVLIDDDLDLLETAAAYLKQNKHQVTIFDSSIKAISYIQKKSSEIELILSDLKLPDLTGVELIQSLRNQNILIPVILITGNRNLETAMDAIQRGAFDYVTKPIQFPQLLISVERAIRMSRLQKDNETLKSAIQIKEGSSFPHMTGRSPRFMKALDLANRVAPTIANVFLNGESGTGKEVFAKHIHQMSPRKDNPFVAINCSAIPENLLESELFGHTKGAFTGATESKLGLFEEAKGGTIFLDEIGDMPISLQAKLLRVIQERRIKRVGENQTRPLDVRIISATHKNLLEQIAHNFFREDLYFRLRVVPIDLPPLRERKEDILPLAEFFLKKYSALNGITGKYFSPSAKDWLNENLWRGNIRELENTIECALVTSCQSEIDIDDLRNSNSNQVLNQEPEQNNVDALLLSGKTMTLDSLTKKYIHIVLKKNAGAKDKTARELDIDRKTLYRKLDEMEKSQAQ
ncbi:MAG: sigma-54-dependent transcriptional regulator [Pseudobdellovibrionaceae bacterium]